MLVLFVYEVCLSCSILIGLSGFKVFRSFLVCISFLDIEIEVSSLVFLLHFKLVLLDLIKKIKSLVMVLYQFSLLLFCVCFACKVLSSIGVCGFLLGFCSVLVYISFLNVELKYQA